MLRSNMVWRNQLQKAVKDGSVILRLENIGNKEFIELC